MKFLQIQQIDPAPTIAIAKGITDFGFVTMTAAVFLILVFVSQWFQQRSFSKMLNNMIDKQQQMLSEILSTQNKMAGILDAINEDRKDEKYQKAKSYGQAWLEISKYKLYLLLIAIKTENHIEDREAVMRKVSLVVQNLHDERLSRFDLFSYKGKKLSDFCDSNWVDKVIKTSMDSLYADDYTDKRLYDNLDITFSEIINEYYKNLQK